MSLFNRLHTLAKAKGQQAYKDFNERALKENSLGRVDGITVCDLSFRHTAPETFLRLTEEAMALIKSLNLRRHRRICRNLDYIVNMELTSVGNFERKLKVCNVDFGKHFNYSDHQWNVWRYACLLIHEATHGVLEEKLILYTKDKRERIESLCHLEEYRFAKRLDPGWADAYIGPFQPERWKLAWEGTPQERLVAYWKRFTEKRPPA